MTPKEKLNKALWTVTSLISDTVVQNVVAAVQGKQLNIDSTTLNRLASLITSSVQEAHSKASGSFSRAVDSSLKEVENDAVIVATHQPRKR